MEDDAALWLFADQLGPHFHSTTAHRHRHIVLIESTRALGRRPYHRQKLHLILSGIRHLAADLPERVTVLRAATYRQGLRRFGEPVLVHEPGSHAAAALVDSLRVEGLVVGVLPTPGFVRSRESFELWTNGRERFRMEDFYRAQRREFGVLLEADGSPTGQQWNFDTENRRRPPKHVDRLDVSDPWTAHEDAIDEEVRADLNRMRDRGETQAVGRDGPRLFPASSSEAESALHRFLRHRLPEFGPYQDAMLTEDWAMAHALLSVPMNLGLLDPLRVVRSAEHEYRRGRAALAGVEGFVRQVLGWRDYVWHLYWHYGPEYLRENVFGARHALPRWWASLNPDEVSAECLRVALSGVRDRGWVYHIQRLMVLGNHALQREYQPEELTHWFATAFVDGFPWVMPANVIGMSQHADGGRVATKPYAAGGAYIDRMSDHCRRCPFDPRRRTGEEACPFTAGYWAWLHRHADALADNPRMKQPLATMRRLADLDAVVDQESCRRHV